MEASSADVGSVVVDELTKQARQEGYIVFAMREQEFWLGVCCVVYFLLGVSWGSRQ